MRTGQFLIGSITKADIVHLQQMMTSRQWAWVPARRFVDIRIIILLPMRRHATPARTREHIIQPIVPIDDA
jgi:hypothetical protein